MKALAIHGSPNKNGNSDTLVESFEKGLLLSGNNSIQHFYANEMNIKPCQGCRTCNYGDYKCTIRDDMYQIYDAFNDVDIVIFATPMYWGYMTAQLKIVFDRMEALAMDPEKYWVNKEFVVILTYNYHYETMVSFFQRIQEYFRFKLNVISYCSLSEDGKEEVHVSNCAAKLEEAFGLGKKLGKMKIDHKPRGADL